jgi:Amt family ammonium transporter
VQFVDKMQIDDPVGAISVHGVCGLWGLISVGLFADGTFGGGFNGTMVNGQPQDLLGLIPAIIHQKVSLGLGQLAAQLIGCVTIIIWSFGASFVFFKILDSVIGMRSKPEDEIAGLDIPETGILAYPTFPSEVDLELAG